MGIGAQTGAVHRSCAGKEDIALGVELWDAAARAGQGLKLAAGSLSLSWSQWQQGAVNRENVKLQSCGDNSVQILTNLKTRKCFDSIHHAMLQHRVNLVIMIFLNSFKKSLFFVHSRYDIFLLCSHLSSDLATIRQERDKGVFLSLSLIHLQNIGSFEKLCCYLPAGLECRAECEADSGEARGQGRGGQQ